MKMHLEPFYLYCPKCKAHHLMVLNTSTCGRGRALLAGTTRLCYGCALKIRGTISVADRKAMYVDQWRKVFGTAEPIPAALQ